MSRDSGIDNRPVLNTAQLLSEEFSQIWEPRQFATEAEYQRAIHGRDQAALCLSGGGIRSASFALGVVQALARKRILTQFQFLSTVSGGGYTGAWLCRWISDAKGGAAEVATALSGLKEPPPVQALREGSNFLTPKPGIASRDTWTVIVICIRNILLNWLVFGPALFLLALIPNFYVAMMYLWTNLSTVLTKSPWGAPYTHFIVPIVALLASAAFLTFSVRAAWLHLPSHREGRYFPQQSSDQIRRFACSRLGISNASGTCPGGDQPRTPVRRDI
jgi:Patatin-like phospholipase